MPRFGWVLLAAVVALWGPARATVVPSPSAGDPRIREVQYAPDQVVLLTATMGYAVTLEFGSGERIETVSIGDSLGWQVTPNRRANLLFIKPIDRGAPTNLTVVSNLRTYDFELRARPRSGDDRAVIYAVKFDYLEPAVATPEAPPPPKPPEPPKDVNHAYSFKGWKALVPIRVFDDGVSTYFKFSEATDLPAIFAIDPDRKETVVNVAQRDGFVVVDRVARGFVLRRGAVITRIINDGYHPDDAQSSSLRAGKDK